MQNKPRMRKIHGTYFCTRPITGVMGMGRTPDESYFDLLERENALSRKKYFDGLPLELCPDFVANAKADKAKADAQAFMQRIHDEAEATQRAMRILYGFRCLVLFGIVMYLYFTK